MPDYKKSSIKTDLIKCYYCIFCEKKYFSTRTFINFILRKQFDQFSDGKYIKYKYPPS